MRYKRSPGVHRECSSILGIKTIPVRMRSTTMHFKCVLVKVLHLLVSVKGLSAPAYWKRNYSGLFSRTGTDKLQELMAAVFLVRGILATCGDYIKRKSAPPARGACFCALEFQESAALRTGGYSAPLQHWLSTAKRGKRLMPAKALVTDLRSIVIYIMSHDS